MKSSKKNLIAIAVVILIIAVLGILSIYVDKIPSPSTYATFWALVPSVVAITLALITKEVYSSLFIGIVIGSVFASGFSFTGSISNVLQDGLIAQLSDSYNVGILIFLVILGTIVALMNKAGCSKAFGDWAATHIKTRQGAQLCTVLLGVLRFIDDYFNCLTVGSVMKPVTDKHRISRAKFAYIIDATAAPICIIAPVSSWAAAVSGFVKGEDGFGLFIKAIPYNYYSFLTLAMMIAMIVMKVEFGSMEKHELNALKGDLISMGDGKKTVTAEETDVVNSNGKVVDLIIPIICLVICCIIGMIYTGGFFSGASFVEAFSNSDASVGLAIGSLFGLLITILLYVIRGVLDFGKCMEAIPEGFKAMVPAILILTFAWTLKGTTDMMGAKDFVQTAMTSASGSLFSFLPAVIFIVGCLMAFATGTSWGTFGILIPIVCAVFEGKNNELMIIAISACMAGAVCGDHCSPISDTTIMASAGAQCNHVNHVSTQLPYAITAAIMSFVAYAIVGPLTYHLHVKWFIMLPIFIAMMVLLVFVLRVIKRRNPESYVNADTRVADAE